MRLRRLILAGFAVIVVLMAAFLFASRTLAPGTSEVVVSSQCLADEVSGDCLVFPTITGQNLLGDDVTAPADLVGQLNLVIVPFSRDQQSNASGWLPVAEELAATYDGFAYYDMAVFPDISPAARLMSRTGLQMLISDEFLQSVTVTVFLEDREIFLEALGLADAETIRVYLLDAEGQVVWQEAGVHTPELGETLTLAVEQFFDET